eukprot:PITA_04774
MHSNESIANYFLRIDEIVNCMKNLGEEIKEVVLVEKFLRSLSPQFESKVSAIEEKQDLQKIIMMQLHEILTAFEMRKGGPLDMREAAFKVSAKGKEKLSESGYFLEEEYEVTFVKNLQRGSGRCPHNKGKMSEEGNRSYYTHDKSNDSSNSDEDIRLLMAHENKDVETEEVTRSKHQLETVTRVREQPQDVVKDQSITIQRLESKILSLKEDLKESKK